MANIASFTGPGTTADAMYAAYQRRAEDWRRDHLGASILGNSCDRYLWQSFRWALNPDHGGKQLRLFERGNRAEAWLIEDLRAAGVEVWDRDPESGAQFRVKWGHIGGGLDGVVLGLIEAPQTPHVLECKTHGSKSFARLRQDGVKKSKPEHYAQMQIYMLGMGLERAFYLAINKDTDELYTERVMLDRGFAEAAIARGRAVVAADEPAPRLVNSEYPPCLYTSADGTLWPCQFYELCHGAAVPERNCRTCVSSSAREDGTWWCEHHNKALSSDEQRAGCSVHLTNPAIVNAQIVNVDEAARKITYQFADGRTVTEGGV